MGDSASEKMSASEIQSKLVAAIRQIAELEDKIEACDKKSKELAGEIERRSRQIFYLERNCEQRDKEISEMKTKNFMLEAKANQEDYEAKIEEQECQLERLQSSQETAKDVLTKYQGMIAKACASSNEIISMFQDELNKSAREHVETKAEIMKLQSQLVDESSTFDMMKQHVRYLEQYRVDSIFRIFGLKAQLKVLTEKVQDQEGINKLASSIGV